MAAIQKRYRFTRNKAKKFCNFGFLNFDLKINAYDFRH